MLEPSGERSPSARIGTSVAVTVRERDIECTVAERSEPASGVVSLVVRDASGHGLPAWTPGAHVDLLLTPTLARQYSLCGDPADTGSWRIAVLREPASRGGSSFVHDQLHPGATVHVRGPRNHFPLVNSRHYLFIAGGIGITPLLPMVAAAAREGADWQLLYGGRTRRSMAFVEELQAYGDAVRIWPQDEKGLLDLAAALGEPRDDLLVYCCGPEALLGAVEGACQSWPAQSLHVERFAPKPQPEAAEAEMATFEVVLQRSGLTLAVAPDESILEVCEDAGVSVLCSCEEGICGTCRTDVLEGTPDHRDSVLSGSERAAGDVMMVCVSRSLTPRLVLDL